MKELQSYLTPTPKPVDSPPAPVDRENIKKLIE